MRAEVIRETKRKGERRRGERTTPINQTKRGGAEGRR